MIKITDILTHTKVVLLLAVFSTAGQAQTMTRGNWSCDSSHLTEGRKHAEDMYERYLYYECLVISGKDSEGLPELYLLADHPGEWEPHSIHASYFLANYLRSDGKLDGSASPDKTDEALKYYFAVLAQAKLEQDSDNDSYELMAALYVPYLYLVKYNHHVPGLDYWNLDEAIRYADECANLPGKAGAGPGRHQAVTASCRLMKDFALKLKPLDEKRAGILAQPHCETVRNTVWEEYPTSPDCPEYDAIHEEIHSLIDDLHLALKDVLGVQAGGGGQQAAGQEESRERTALERELAGEMVSIPGGSFDMGDLSGDGDEGPVRNVTVPAFRLGKHEVTFAQWDACVADGGCNGYTPDDEGWGRGNRPVINVSWDDAQSFIAWLNGKTGGNYRLPTEAEWEYAARAGSTTKYSWGNSIGSNRANCGGNGCGDSYGNTAPVGSFPANAWGLHDLHGNVSEWALDCWNGSYAGAPTDGSAWESGDCGRRVVRGGSWTNDAWPLRSAFRVGFDRALRSHNGGFRLAQDQFSGEAVQEESRERTALERELAGEMVSIPGGSFDMGDLSGEGDDGELPVHSVTVPAFRLGKHEVTFAQWDACVADGGCNGYSPGDVGWGRGNRPVIEVSWDDIQAYIAWLNGRTGGNYRLPTEAEWEYAARAGSTTLYSWGDDIGSNRANCSNDMCGDSYEFTAPVGSFPANAWGLHDMHGNVSEWVQDCYNYGYEGAPSDGSAWESGNCDYGVIRGGAWYDYARYLRSADRGGNVRASRNNSVGFRLAQDQ